MKKIPIRINKNTSQERFIGMFYPERNLFVKRVKLSKHLFRVLDAWGIDGGFFTDVLLPNKTTIVVAEEEERKEYKITAEKFNKKGRYYHFKNKKRDDRAQIFCPRRFWDIKEPKTKEEEMKEMAQNGVFG